ncbi:MAG: hypothetical protein CL532_00680 [Aestuariivita sp.]|nr:hypothetical protein [Aestuariivita sp.]
MASLTLLAVDTIYLTYDTYTTADALDYAEAPSTLAEKIADSSTYLTKVRSLTVGDDYSYTVNVNTIARTTGTLAASATTSIGLTMIAGDNFPASGKALIGAEVISYATTTEVGSSTTALNTLVRGLSSTVDVSHSTSSGIFPIEAGIVTSIDHNKDDDVFNINTSCTIPSAQYAAIVETNLFTIPASEVAMVKYVA